MTDRDDIITGLQCCTSDSYTCSVCPFREQAHENEYGESEVMNESGERYNDYDCSFRLMQAALKLIESEVEENED